MQDSPLLPHISVSCPWAPAYKIKWADLCGVASAGSRLHLSRTELFVTPIIWNVWLAERCWSKIFFSSSYNTHPQLEWLEILDAFILCSGLARNMLLEQYVYNFFLLWILKLSSILRIYVHLLGPYIWWWTHSWTVLIDLCIITKKNSLCCLSSLAKETKYIILSNGKTISTCHKKWC
jgi:hypothetical protein